MAAEYVGVITKKENYNPWLYLCLFDFHVMKRFWEQKSRWPQSMFKLSGHMADLSCASYFKKAALFLSALRSTRRWCAERFLATSCSFSQWTETPLPPHSRPCHLQDGRQQNRVLDTTSQQMFAPVQSVQTSNWIHCHVLSLAARTLGMTVIINTLVQTLIKLPQTMGAWSSWQQLSVVWQNSFLVW